MRISANRISAAVGLGVLALVLPATSASAATGCVFDWAKPGTYEIRGNFRGEVESASAKLTSDCRVTLQIPGVFAGSKVTRAGSCLKFSFKVDWEKHKTYTARWCDGHGVVPWDGRSVRATVVLRRPGSAPSKRPRTNFNSK